MNTNCELLLDVKLDGDINKVLLEIPKFYDINTKKSYSKPEFIYNYLSLLLKENNLQNIKLYLDRDILEEDNLYCYHKNGNIFVSERFLKSNNFFGDLLVLAHEFKHALILNDNNNFNRYVGKNSGEFIYSYNPYLLKKLDIHSEESLKNFYLTNKSETEADKFSYEFVLKLINLSERKIKQNTIEHVLLKQQREKLELAYNINKAIWEKTKTNLSKDINNIKKMQEDMFTKFEFLLMIYVKIENDSIDKKQFINDLKSNQDNLLYSFEVLENLELLDKMKNLCYKNSKKTLIFALLYIDCLNYPNYIVTKEDIKKVNSIFKKYKKLFNFSLLNIDASSFKETLLEIEYGSYNKDFEKSTDITKLTNNKSLKMAYSKFLRDLNKKNKNTEEIF